MIDENRPDVDINIEDLMTLARIDLSEAEKVKIAHSLKEILDYFRELSEVNVGGVKESAHAFPLYNVLRNDKAGPRFSVESALLNAPEQRDNQFVVPKVVE
ncbi:MAG: Asp-tRNA(Asn)/Glu-tRNA(Gln) amidotransferase subunit GatC [Puniceicoccales bacterium]|jgi:aspartyl-tRNA(Asn)/glutamyl-tRNA(Gln) amidotransferase subunit C|nr:Asp-tRNA(Asn)/Glu-tRNA(Gln) amidotransferase subunit GatC [Puniceicoccales bacterium]